MLLSLWLIHLRYFHSAGLQAELSTHFVRRKVVGKHVTSDNLSGKCLRDELRHAVNRLLPSAGVGTLASLLRWCANAKALPEGRSIHQHITKLGYDGDTYLGNNLIQMYGKCGKLQEAITAFEHITILNIYSFNTMISAYAQNGHLLMAKSLFDKMPEWDSVSWTAMLVANAHNGDVDSARSMFDRMPCPDLVAWNAIVAAYAQRGRVSEATMMFRQMDIEGIGPDKVSFLSIIQAFTTPGALPLAKQIHGLISSDYSYETDVVLGTALVDMYGKCGSSEDAGAVFRSLSRKNVVTWTAMLVSYAQNGHLQEAGVVYGEMPEKNVVSTNAMMTAYAQNGHLSTAREMFDEMTVRDLNSWNIMIAMYNQVSEHSHSLRFFKRLVVEGFQPDKYTFVGALDACASIPAVTEGRLIHQTVLEAGLEQDMVVGNAVMNLYGKSGLLHEARGVFNGMMHRNNLNLWNTMIASYSKNGHSVQALELFTRMHLHGVLPDEITLVSVIFACSHGGFYDRGWRFFVSMEPDFGVHPFRDHYMGMIDLLARAGQLRDAEELIKEMPVEADDIALRTLLSACKTHGEFGRGGKVVEVDSVSSASDFVLLSYCVAKQQSG